VTPRVYNRNPTNFTASKTQTSPSSEKAELASRSSKPSRESHADVAMPANHDHAETQRLQNALRINRSPNQVQATYIKNTTSEPDTLCSAKQRRRYMSLPGPAPYFSGNDTQDRQNPREQHPAISQSRKRPQIQIQR